MLQLVLRLVSSMFGNRNSSRAAWQAYGMMGWRCGYIAFPTPEAGAPADLGAQLTKVQDTIPICASQVMPPFAGITVCKLAVAPTMLYVLMSTKLHGQPIGRQPCASSLASATACAT